MQAEATVIAVLLAASAAADPLFRPVDMPAHVYSGGWEHFVGGGLAVFDCDGDRLPELYAAGGSAPAMLLRNRSVPMGDPAFVADTPGALALTGVTGAYPLDIDGDGQLDLAVLRVGENRLFRGGDNCIFAPFDDLGFDSDDRWTTGFSATWEPASGLPTLAFGNYVDRTDPDGPFRACDVNRLYRPEGARYGPPRDLSPGFCPLSMLFTDWDRRGRADLRISNDRHYYVTGGGEQMWAMEEAPRLYGAGDGWRSHQLWGMGIAQRDLDGDGLAEVFLTSMGDQRLQRRVAGAAGPAYEDVPYEMGTTAHRPYLGGDGRPSTGWHVAFGDVDNDGRDDVFIAKGNVQAMPDSAHDDPNNLLMQGPGGRFAEAGGAAGLASLHRGRGAALADLNGDGWLDVAVVNRRAPLEVWRNVTGGPGHWLAVSLAQQGPNVNAVGAWIELETGGRRQLREITVGGGHAGGTALPEHFGLGPAGSARLRVTWPDGTVSGWQEIPANRQVVLRRDGDALAVSY
ncbi:CRTAC1 family protein [Pukyongiella litopenaei]|uniref:CRTAC1 family protein n=1 Tax=Pukyongiella litopenaei TaxID=2605946 RepID=A0A2S0MTB7_9RHOB|nr:CRTAC1 family protein [Pukyongiella litopenaei]AVO38971.1 CRTAC1 family protein [Pukyongiella litopenaei]